MRFCARAPPPVPPTPPPRPQVLHQVRHLHQAALQQASDPLGIALALSPAISYPGPTRAMPSLSGGASSPAPSLPPPGHKHSSSRGESFYDLPAQPAFLTGTYVHLTGMYVHHGVAVLNVVC